MHFLILMRWNGGKNVTEIEKKKKRDKIKFTTISVISLCVFFGVWYVATAVMHLMPDYSLPSPVQVVEAFFYKLGNKAPDGGTLFQHIAASLKVALTGYLLGAVIGIPLGICMAWFRRIDLFVTPLFDLVRPVPTIAWIPLMILWFGIGEMSKVFIIIIGTFVPCLLNAYNGVRLVDPDLYDVIRVLGGKRRDEIFHVCFPASFPAVFAGLQISLSSAWTCVLAAELMNSRDGMGFLIKRGMDTHQPTLVLGGMVLIAAAAYGTSLLVTLFEGKLCPWKRTIENL